jgi:adenylate cyclase
MLKGVQVRLTLPPVQKTLSDDVLRSLIEERLKPGADSAMIDARIWEDFGEEWCVMATDLAGFSRGVAEAGIIQFLQTIHESERLLLPIVERFSGTLLKVEGDSFLVIFSDVASGLSAAAAMQRATRQHNRDRAAIEQIVVGIGLGFGRMLRVAPREVFGNEVNSACILGETYATRHDVLVTDAVKRLASSEWQFEPFEFTPPGAGAAWRVVLDA